MRVHLLGSRSLIQLLLLVAVLWFGSNAYTYIAGNGGPDALFSYLLLLSLTLLYVLQRAALHRSLLEKQDEWLRFFLVWMALYVVYGILEYLNSTGDPVAEQALVTVMGRSLLACAFAVLMAGSRRLRVVIAAFALLAVIGTAVDIFDFVHPTFSNVPGRAAGLYVNPTIAGNFIAMAMVAGVIAVRRSLRLAYVLICGIGILVTFSRESWIIWGLAVIWLGWQGYFGSVRQRLVMIVAALVVGGGITGLLFAGKIGGLVGDSSLQTYLTPNTAARLGIQASVLSGESVSTRQDLVTASIREAVKAPLIGHGLGYTAEWHYSQGTHNMYLLFLVEGGLLGATLYLALMALLWFGGTGVGRVIALQVAVSSLFSHNHLEQSGILMLMAFVVAHGAVVRSEIREFRAIGLHQAAA